MRGTISPRVGLAVIAVAGQRLHTIEPLATSLLGAEVAAVADDLELAVVADERHQQRPTAAGVDGAERIADHGSVERDAGLDLVDLGDRLGAHHQALGAAVGGPVAVERGDLRDVGDLLGLHGPKALGAVEQAVEELEAALVVADRHAGLGVAAPHDVERREAHALDAHAGAVGAERGREVAVA
jgi:hypothetical protein